MQLDCNFGGTIFDSGSGSEEVSQPVIWNISPDVWPAGPTTQVTISGQHFGTALPTLNISDSTINHPISSHSESQIVANITPPGATQTEVVDVSVTNNGGDGFLGGEGQTATSPNSSATVQASGSPSVAITMSFTGSKSPGDNLSFGGSSHQTDCSESLGPQTCISLWDWNVEGTGVVTDNAANWAVTQTKTLAFNGFYKDSRAC